MRKYSKFKDFKRLVAEELGVAVDRQLWWGWAKRVNHSYRPYELFTEVQDEMYICAIKEEPASKLARSWPRLNLYLQVHPCTFQFLWPFTLASPPQTCSQEPIEALPQSIVRKVNPLRT